VINLGFVFCRDVIKAGEEKLKMMRIDGARKLFEEAKKVLSF